MPYRIKNITVAIALAVVAAMLTLFYVTNYQRDVRSNETNVTVYVAARDIPVGTSGSDASSKGFFEKSEVVRRNVVPGAISSPDQISELVATQPVLKGEQVSTRRFAPQTTRGISAQLTGTQRAISMPGAREQLLVGTLKKGDRVDVVAAFEHGLPYSRIILRDLLVLKAPATGAAGEKLSSSSRGGFAVMLAVTDVQVQKLYWADKNGQWHLELRPVTDAVDSPENVESSKSLLHEGVTPKQLAQAKPDSQLGGN